MSGAFFIVDTLVTLSHTLVDTFWYSHFSPRHFMVDKFVTHTFTPKIEMLRHDF